jgi:hypothetical protein
MAGYSATPLAKKLGIKPNYTMRLIDSPDYYFDLFTDLPQNVLVLNETKTKKNFIHWFVKSMNAFEKNIVSIQNEIEQNGIIWISWYKKSSGILTDVTEDKIRATALANGLVDVKVCAVDEVWSGLKLVIPLKSRK